MDFHDDDDDMRRNLSKYLFASGPVRTRQNFACFWKHFVNNKPFLKCKIFVTMKGKMDSNRNMFEWEKRTDNE